MSRGNQLSFPKIIKNQRIVLPYECEIAENRNEGNLNSIENSVVLDNILL